jgi:S-adenosylmethionine:tRNA ribosyltransferase-isomerase
MSNKQQTQPLLMTDFDYDLPPELIAQVPLEVRSASRLLVLDRSKEDVEHTWFAQLGSYLNPGDLLVFNDTRVIPARLHGHRESGGRVEFLLLRRDGPNDWLALAKPAGRLRLGERIVIDARDEATGHSSAAIVREKLDEGQVRIELEDEVQEHLNEFGQMPLPPYITGRLEDDERYQTIYARLEGSAAAPTAGLHFTEEILEQLRDQGIGQAYVTLHVGLDTFRPVTEDDARAHRIHREWCAVSAETIEQIRSTTARGARVIAVGTTSARTLETWGQRAAAGDPAAFASDTSIYITPGYAWTVVDGLFTNFHLPKSTLLLMVSALAGRERILDAYRLAVAERYRFFSFGDAMLIL